MTLLSRAQHVFAFVCTAFCAHSAIAQEVKAFPTKPIRLLVPYAPGGTTDFAARVVGTKLTEMLGQTVVVDNRPGAGSIVGTDAAAKSNADGYTIVMVDTGFSITPALYAKLPFDAVRDFTPITEVIRVSNWLVINPSVPAKSVSDLVALAKAKPGQLTFGSGGVGSPFHMAGEQLKLAAKIDITHVPYKGGGPAISDLIGGQITMAFPTMAVALPLVNGGKLRALAVVAPKRAPVLPDIPTIAEAGVPGVTLSSWYGVLAPAKLPKPLVDKLYGEIMRALEAPDVRKRFSTQSAEVIGSSPAQFRKLIESEITTWRDVAKAGGIKPE
ncbi:MAG TPA: tripartite tricarboxylate transporter substrate binding protein [Burkholderiales bacterium]|jgi:tripartite-type tricarboxylate transporter receptor subunit TctC|nr:tripartite tricarboxylate transporter substrate binding protein [Burkholderiales bacterium]